MFFENAESLMEFAASFARTLRAPNCVALHGDLGAGKTSFARAVIRELCGADAVVPSPTFTIVQNYGNISHFDLYRVKTAAELEEIGFFDALAENIVLIEWPEIAAPFLPSDAIHIFISAKEGGREVELRQ
jgi:tRNA threonylcarbamoyl adenosine modification protein YjeE